MFFVLRGDCHLLQAKIFVLCRKQKKYKLSKFSLLPHLSSLYFVFYPVGFWYKGQQGQRTLIYMRIG